MTGQFQQHGLIEELLQTHILTQSLCIIQFPNFPISLQINLPFVYVFWAWNREQVILLPKPEGEWLSLPCSVDLQARFASERIPIDHNVNNELIMDIQFEGKPYHWWQHEDQFQNRKNRLQASIHAQWWMGYQPWECSTSQFIISINNYQLSIIN